VICLLMSKTLRALASICREGKGRRGGQSCGKGSGPGIKVLWVRAQIGRITGVNLISGGAYPCLADKGENHAASCR
jgi:hypothetical protein